MQTCAQIVDGAESSRAMALEAAGLEATVSAAGSKKIDLQLGKTDSVSREHLKTLPRKPLTSVRNNRREKIDFGLHGTPQNPTSKALLTYVRNNRPEAMNP